MSPDKFQCLVLRWFDIHGRKNLPWQIDPTPYKVWVSEIMLQQTQVTTVIPYFNNFINRFPDVETLAHASLDAVLQHWSGLGYYARARNLHKSSRQINQLRRFPDNFEDLLQLPGIGKSTAGAILSLAFAIPQPILDGNVKRVFSRYKAIRGWSGNTKVSKLLWGVSAEYTPSNRIADYTQAMMDLGATVCTRTQPECNVCPLQGSCQAKQQNLIAMIPTPKPAKTLPVKKAVFIVWMNAQQAVFLEKRPSSGIWGGLWSFPEFRDKNLPIEWLQHRNVDVQATQLLPERRHTFTHFHLDFTAMLISSAAVNDFVLDVDQSVWYKLQQLEGLGLPAPIKKLLKELTLKEDNDD